MATTSATDDESSAGSTETDRVDPRAPRFGQAITATFLLIGFALGAPIFVYAVAVILATSVLSGWRLDLYGFLWRTVASRFVDPAPPEPAAPHRFAKLVGATGTVLASALILADLELAGFLVALGIAAAAGLAATTGICLGCRMYRSVSLFRRLDVV